MSRDKKVIALCHMLGEGYDELVCDFAEYYRIDISRIEDMDFLYLSTLACGLRAESRIVMKLFGLTHTRDTQLLGRIADLLHILAWQNTKDGQKNRKRPKPHLQYPTKQVREHETFGSAAEFESKMKEIENGV